MLSGLRQVRDEDRASGSRQSSYRPETDLEKAIRAYETVVNVDADFRDAQLNGAVLAGGRFDKASFRSAELNAAILQGGDRKSVV